eukprot:TRINITY_DN16437_c0_g2_i1.p1 TRINITY_DN16437_c0_g2~~TRINITY_DN16437_c0_g2_i1.p1  ORF type:complete len:176 (-),score=22.92 TRINITY_DN16437_c0_g2_i1:167-694(-)
MSVDESLQNLSLDDPGYIVDVAEYLASHSNEVEKAIGALNQRRQMLKFTENDVLQKRQRLQQREMELRRTLNCLKMLTKKAEAEDDALVDFCIADNMFAKAKVPPAQTVNLWLGADIMLEYTLADALELITSNLDKAQTSLAANKEEWNKVKDCVTTTEVNIARVYNHGKQGAPW